MPMSKHVSDGLTECFERGERRPSEEPTKVASGEWFCPACGVAMLTTTGVEVRCPECARTLNEFVYELIELHPHA
jgi:rubrerythrin